VGTISCREPPASRFGQRHVDAHAIASPTSALILIQWVSDFSPRLQIDEPIADTPGGWSTQEPTSRRIAICPRRRRDALRKARCPPGIELPRLNGPTVNGGGVGCATPPRMLDPQQAREWVTSGPWPSPPAAGDQVPLAFKNSRGMTNAADAVPWDAPRQRLLSKRSFVYVCAQCAPHSFPYMLLASARDMAGYICLPVPRHLVSQQLLLRPPSLKRTQRSPDYSRTSFQFPNRHDPSLILLRARLSPRVHLRVT
jgi:hypothetical protein